MEFIFSPIRVIRRMNWALTPKPLYHQTLFWTLGIIVPLILFLGFGYFYWRDYSFCFSAACFDYFFLVSKVPLLLLSTSIPLISIINNIHRTVQTNEQIEKTKEKNEYDKYFSHEKNIVDKISEIEERRFSFMHELNYVPGSIDDNIETECIMKIKRPYILYKKIFPSNNPGGELNYNPDFLFLSKIKSSWKGVSSLTIKNNTEFPFDNNELFFLQNINFIS
ncbi:hypothetical protein [Budvicia aquatica]|uniref:hypothetical protein n=1 Tax=Budvicia aquatica TaxID=82979 RepID=UPI0020826400|nr:hypothetical protein [Budvicia aquatica]GKX52211.1 hypothetical protein SOASR029_25200 [Budvicia aquatica]